jgi:hypothetical protein
MHKYEKFFGSDPTVHEKITKSVINKKPMIRMTTNLLINVQSMCM